MGNIVKNPRNFDDDDDDGDGDDKDKAWRHYHRQHHQAGKMSAFGSRQKGRENEEVDCEDLEDEDSPKRKPEIEWLHSGLKLGEIDAFIS